MDRCASPRLRVDDDLPFDHLYAFLHACETQPTSIHDIDPAKSDTEIADFKMYLFGRSPKLHLKTSNATVLHSVVQRLLQDAI